MRLAVVGSRTFTNKRRLYFELDEMRKTFNIHEIVSGGAKSGADLYAKEYAMDRRIHYKEFPADWRDFGEPCVIKTGTYGQYNALAGFKRNETIADYSDEAIAFWTGKSPGTKDVISRFQNKAKKVRIVLI